MRKIKAYLDTGFAGCRIEEEFEVEDDATQEQIEEEAREAVFNSIDWGWNEVLDSEENKRCL